MKRIIQIPSFLIVFFFLLISMSPILQINQTNIQGYSPQPFQITASNKIINMGNVAGNFSAGNNCNNFTRDFNYSSPSSIAMDYQNRNLYASSSSYIFQIATSTDKITNATNVGKCIEWIGYDPANSLLYAIVLDNFSLRYYNNCLYHYNSSIISFNPITGNISKPIITFEWYPYSPVIDSTNNSLFFKSSLCVLSELNLTTNKVDATFNVSSTYGLIYSKERAFLYIGDECSFEAINTLNNSISFTYNFRNATEGFIYDNISNKLIFDFYYSHEIVVLNGTTGAIESKFNCAILSDGIAYNPHNQYAYFYSYNGSIRILNASTLTQGGCLKIPPFGSKSPIYREHSAYDAINNQVYIGYTVQGGIVAIDGNLNHPNGTIYLGPSFPVGMFYDKYNNVLYVSTNNGTLRSFNATTLTPQGQISTGLCSSYFALDPSSGYLYVSNSLSNTVSIVNTRTFSVVKNVTVGSYPGSIFYCSKTNDVYTLNRNSGNITVFTASGSVITSIPFFIGYFFGKPISMIYDKSTGDIYVFFGKTLVDTINLMKMQYVGYFIGLRGGTEGEGIGCTVLDPITGRILESSGTAWIPSTNNTTPLPSLHHSFLSAVYDPANQNIIAIETNASSGFLNSIGIAVINATTEYLEGNITVGSSIQSIAVDTSDNTIFALSPHSAKILIVKLFPEYNVNFRETGMNSPVSWFINMNGRPANFTIGSSSESIYLPNGTYSYTIGTTQLYSASPHSGTVHVDGSGITVTVTFSFEYSQYLEQNYIYFLTIAGIAIAGIYFIWRRRR